MTGPGYVIIEASEIRRYAPEFQATLRELEARVLENSAMVWAGLSYGGLTPREKQFGRTTFLPQHFAPERRHTGQRTRPRHLGEKQL